MSLFTVIPQGPFESKCRKQLSLSSFGWVLILSGEFKITSGVLSLGKLCDEHGYSYEWTNGQKPHLIENGIRIQCNTENFVPIVVPGLSTSSSWSLPSSTSMTPSRHEINHPKSYSSSSTSPPMTSSTVSSESVDRQERWDPHTDHHPAIVSSESVDRQVRGTVFFWNIRRVVE